MHSGEMRRRYQGAYRDDSVNHCPGCARTHWLIGRMTAECAFCATALPLSAPAIGGRTQLEMVP